MATAGRTARLFIGCAGWSIPKEHKDAFPAVGSHLERYASVLPAVEINSSFYRPHRVTTYERWAASVPDHFRFAVKVPREITHHLQLQNSDEPLNRFLDEVVGLGSKLGPLLVQLPPKFRYDGLVVGTFLGRLRKRFDGLVVWEPRHESWFTEEPGNLLDAFQVARVAVDPAVVPAAAEPGGWSSLIYHRLHGSPEMYYSVYSTEYLHALQDKLSVPGNVPVWCIFDNTALGAAVANALDLWRRVALQCICPS